MTFFTFVSSTFDKDLNEICDFYVGIIIILKYYDRLLEAVHKVRHASEGEGVYKSVTVCDSGEGGCPAMSFILNFNYFVNKIAWCTLWTVHYR